MSFLIIFLEIFKLNFILYDYFLLNLDHLIIIFFYFFYFY